MLRERESRPGANRTAGVSTATKTGTSIAPAGYSLSDLDDMAAYINGAFVVVVKVEDQHYRRRCYLSAKAAENAARSARARGATAEVYLAELHPVWRVDAPSDGGGP